MKIYCFGEALIDFIQAPPQRTDLGPGTVPSFQQFAGGAPANVAVAVARLGGRAEFVGGLGNDGFANFIRATLTGHGVGMSRSVELELPTALAFVALDRDGDRSFEFRRQDTADLHYPLSTAVAMDFMPGDILHLCSNTLCTPAAVEVTHRLMAQASQCGALVSFDINYRPALWRDRPDGEAQALIWATARSSDLVKVSSDELEVFAPGSDHPGRRLGDLQPDDRCSVIIGTSGPGPVQAWLRGADPLAIICEPPTTTTVDTTGAGDAFVGSLLVQLCTATIGPHQLRERLKVPRVLESWLRWAIDCGGLAAKTRGATLPSRALSLLSPRPELR